MIDLKAIPSGQKSRQQYLFQRIREFAWLQLAIPDELRQELEAMLSDLFPNMEESIDSDRVFFRVRRNSHEQSNTPIESSDMGAPNKRSSLGRMNLAGDSILYTASDCETSIAEVRPEVGDYLTIAEFKPKLDRKLKIANFLQYPSPTKARDEDEFSKTIHQMTKAFRFSKKGLSRQFHHDDPGRYLDTIYIAQVLKEKGFDGIAYRSSLNTGGINYAFFSEENLECATQTRVKKIESISIGSSDV
jgi:RES domain